MLFKLSKILFLKYPFSKLIKSKSRLPTVEASHVRILNEFQLSLILLLSVKNFCNEVTTYSEDSDFNNDSPIIINGFCASLINFETS